MRCPKCGYGHTMEQDEMIKELWYCNFCHLWYFIVPLATHLPENPDTLRARKRFAEMDAQKTREVVSRELEVET